MNQAPGALAAAGAAAALSILSAGWAAGRDYVPCCGAAADPQKPPTDCEIKPSPVCVPAGTGEPGAPAAQEIPIRLVALAPKERGISVTNNTQVFDVLVHKNGVPIPEKDKKQAVEVKANSVAVDIENGGITAIPDETGKKCAGGARVALKATFIITSDFADRYTGDLQIWVRQKTNGPKGDKFGCCESPLRFEVRKLVLTSTKTVLGATGKVSFTIRSLPPREGGVKLTVTKVTNGAPPVSKDLTMDKTGSAYERDYNLSTSGTYKVEAKETAKDGCTATPLMIEVKDGGAEFRVRQLTFKGPTQSIVPDDGGSYPIEHWLDRDKDGLAIIPGKPPVAENRIPICYVKGANPSFDVIIDVDDPNNMIKKAEVTVRAEGPGGVQINKRTQISGSEIRATLNWPGPLSPEGVRVYNPFEIRWSVSIAGSGDFISAGTTENRVYVTSAAAPKTAKLFETVVDIACRNADGVSEDKSIFDAIWADFENPSYPAPFNGVKKKEIDGFNNPDGREMAYWNPAAPRLAAGGCSTMALMLADPGINPLGTCAAWSETFHKSLKAVGLPGVSIFHVVPASGPADGILVRNWNFGKHVRSGADGVCQSKKLAGSDDVEIGTGVDSDGLPRIPAPSERPDLCIAPGANGALDTEKFVDKGDSSVDGMIEGDGAFRYIRYIDPGFLAGDVALQTGIPGQGNPNPPAVFQDHYIVKDSTGAIFDPSYGLTGFSSDTDYEDKAFAGYPNAMNHIKRNVIGGNPDIALETNQISKDAEKD